MNISSFFAQPNPMISGLTAETGSIVSAEQTRLALVDARGRGNMCKNFAGQVLHTLRFTCQKIASERVRFQKNSGGSSTDPRPGSHFWHSHRRATSFTSYYPPF